MHILVILCSNFLMYNMYNVGVVTSVLNLPLYLIKEAMGVNQTREWDIYISLILTTYTIMNGKLIYLMLLYLAQK